jgi:hypothetical protein
MHCPSKGNTGIWKNVEKLTEGKYFPFSIQIDSLYRLNLFTKQDVKLESPNVE